MKKKLLLGLICVLALTGCGHVKLANGENAIVEFKNVEGISSDDLYKELKANYGGSVLVSLIDSRLLNKLYETDSEEKKYVSQVVDSTKETAKSMNVDVETYLAYYFGVDSVDAYENYLSLNYKRNLWKKDYALESVTDKQLNEYYKDEYTGDIEAKHILISVNVASDASSEDKEKAEADAKAKAMDIINKLKNGEKFDDLAKEYSDDKSTSENGGSLGKINVGDYDDDVFTALKNLKVDTYSTTPVLSTYGYHVLYKVSQDEKPELNDEVTAKIKKIIASEI
jgi:foldase protein PrsA